MSFGGIWGSFVGFLESVLLAFFDFAGNAGLAIILFTIVARVFILPLTVKSIRSTRKIQELQPQIKEMQRKYGKDPQKLNEETMKLYREYKVNPAGGCLPLLLQLPIFLGVYQAVINLTPKPAESVAQVMLQVIGQSGLNVSAVAETIGRSKLTGGFLWLDNLGGRDPYFILPVLSVLFQLIVQLMATPRVQDAQQKAMSQSMLVMPIVFGYIGFTFPSGAVLYWVAGSILSMIQQYVISGWGSLANYLKFLPTHGGLFPPTIPTAVTASATASGAEDGQKIGFWDVLRPLMEQEVSVEQADGHDEAARHATHEAQRQANQLNPRRRKSRH